jgi:hypothetical protein
VSNYKEKEFDQRVVWTLGGTSPAASVIVFADSSIADVAPTIASLQATVTVSAASAHFKCKVGFQVSGDGLSWDNAVYFGAPDFQIGNGVLVCPWYNGTANYKKKIRFVLSAEQDGTSNVLEMANVIVVIGFMIK